MTADHAGGCIGADCAPLRQDCGLTEGHLRTDAADLVGLALGFVADRTNLGVELGHAEVVGAAELPGLGVVDRRRRAVVLQNALGRVGQGERAGEVHDIAAPVRAVTTFADGVDHVGAQAAEVRAAVLQRVVPAGVAGDGAADEVVADRGREAERVAEGVEHQSRDEQRCGVATGRDAAEAGRLQADIGAARELAIAIETTRLAGVRAHELLGAERGGQAAAEVFAPADTPPAGAHVAAVDGAQLRAARRLAGRNAQVDQAAELDVRLGLGGSGQGGGCDDRGQEGSAFHGSGLSRLWGKLRV